LTRDHKEPKRLRKRGGVADEKGGGSKGKKGDIQEDE